MGAVELSRLLLQRRADFLIRPHIFARWRRDLDVEQPVDHVVLRRKEPLHRVDPLGQSLAVVEPVDSAPERAVAPAAGSAVLRAPGLTRLAPPHEFPVVYAYVKS